MLQSYFRTLKANLILSLLFNVFLILWKLISMISRDLESCILISLSSIKVVGKCAYVTGSTHNLIPISLSLYCISFSTLKIVAILNWCRRLNSGGLDVILRYQNLRNEFWLSYLSRSYRIIICIINIGFLSNMIMILIFIIDS